MPQYNELGEIRAAGGLVVHPHAPGPRILLVHRPAYGDWSIPKGKVKRGEDDRAVALREVCEETGLTCAVGPHLGELHYRDRKGRTKVVRYWAMSPMGGHFEENAEVDACAWFDLQAAAARATRSGERAFLSMLSNTVRCAGRAGHCVVEAFDPTIVYEMP